MGKNRKHHYLPKSLLKMFVFSNDSIWQFSKSKNKIEQKNVNNVAYVKDLYLADIQEDDNKDPLFFEKEISKIENYAIELIKKISHNNYKLNISDKELLSLYLFFLEMRTPAARQQMSIMADGLLKPIFVEYLKHKKDVEQKLIEYIKNFMNLELDNNGHIGNMAYMAEEFISYYKQKHWTFATCDNDRSFIIGDNPALLYMHPTNLSKGGIIQEGSFKYFPIRKDLALFMGDFMDLDCSWIKLSKNEIRQLNIDMITHSREYSYAVSKEQLQYLIKKSSLEPFTIENTFKYQTLKTDKKNEEIIWGHNFYSLYLQPQIRLKLERQRNIDIQKSSEIQTKIIPEV